MLLYHGTSRVFDSFDAAAQAGGQLGNAFYFTDSETVAETFAAFRHPPEMAGFDSQADLDAYLAERPGWTLTYQDEVGGNIVASFTTPDSIPQVIAVELEVTRPLVLDAPAPKDFVAAIVSAGVSAAEWQSTQEVWHAALEHFHGRPIEADDDLQAANARLNEIVQAAGYDAVNRADERNGVAHRTWIAFDAEKVTIVSRRELG